MSKLELVLPIPPSVNKYLYPKIVKSGRKSYVRLAETSESIRYKKKNYIYIENEMFMQKWEQPAEGVKVDVHIDYYFKQKGQDPNNYLKILYDMFEDIGIYINDDAAKPQTGIVVIDKYHPRLEVTITKSPQVGVFENEQDRTLFIEEYENSMPKRSFDALMKKLDQGRITSNVYYDENRKLRMKEEEY